MTFDINEARAIIEEAKQRGLIRAPGSESEVSKPPTQKKPDVAEETVLPGWLQEGIRQGPLIRPDSDRQ